MAKVAELDYILSDCFLAVGQAVGVNKGVDFEVVTWWHRRYRHAFDDAITSRGASWGADRDRVTAVGRYLGERAVHHSSGHSAIGRTAAARASDEVERGCQMTARSWRFESP